MDISTLSDGQLFNLIVIFGVGGFICLAAIIAAGAFEVRKRKQEKKGVLFNHPEFEYQTQPDVGTHPQYDDVEDKQLSSIPKQIPTKETSFSSPQPQIDAGTTWLEQLRPKTASSSVELPSTKGGVENKMGSLLKSSGKKKGLLSGKKITPPSLQVKKPEIREASSDGDYRELLRVLVNPLTKEIIVEVDGQHYHNIKEIKERTIGQRILETAAALLKFTGGVIATATGVKALSVPQVALTAIPKKVLKPKVPQIKSSQPSVEAPQTEAEEQPISTGGGLLGRINAYVEPPTPKEVEAPKPTQTPIAKPSVSDFRPQANPTPSLVPKDVGFAPSLVSSTLPLPSEPEKVKDDEPLLSFNLADTIDAIVQRKLELANNRTRVKIQTGLGGMIQILVGGNKYEFVDDVEDPVIRGIIQSAIDEFNS